MARDTLGGTGDSLTASPQWLGQVRPSDHNLVTWTFPPFAQAASATPSQGNRYFYKLVPCEYATTVTGIRYATGGTASTGTPANWFLALHRANGQRIGVSADLAANNTINTAYAAPLTVEAGQSLAVAVGESLYVQLVLGTVTSLTLRSTGSGSSPISNLGITSGAKLRGGVITGAFTSTAATFDPSTLVAAATTAPILAGVY